MLQINFNCCFIELKLGARTSKATSRCYFCSYFVHLKSHKKYKNTIFSNFSGQQNRRKKIKLFIREAFEVRPELNSSFY